MDNKTILVVDDDPGIVTLVETMLKRDGYTTIAAFSGEEALQQYEINKPHLILLDLAMPGMDGFEVIATIRNREQGIRHTPIVLLTAHAQQYYDNKSQNADIDGYIAKPVTGAKLREDLARFVFT